MTKAQKTAKAALLRGAALLAIVPAMLLAVVAPASAQSLPRDGSYTCGRLENGLTYYIRHNAKEPGLADFYIAQRVGSILEEPRQRGLAHFLEHMAFNGSENFGHDGKMGIVPWCETVGVKFGANLNAYTSVDQTVYHIGSVPLKREGVLDSALLILHDWSHYLLLTDEEIDKERGVIHEEWRTRDAGKAVTRMMERVLPTVYAGTKYADCLPIGSMQIVDNFPYGDLRDYYQKWYRPDLQAIIVVGDIDVKAVEAKIRDLFGSIPMPENPAPREYYPVSDNDTLTVAIDRDAEQPVILATLYMKRDATPDSLKDSEEYLRGSYVSSLVTSMLNNRLQELKNQANPPFLSGSVADGSFLVSRTKDAFTVHIGCRQEGIRRSLHAVVGAVEQARQHGFTEQELARAKSQLLKQAEKLNAERDNRRNGYYVKRALNHYLEAEPLITDDYRLTLYQKWDAQVTLAQVNAEARVMISDSNQVLTVYAPDKPGMKLPCYRCFTRFVREAQDSVYQPYAEKALPASLMAQQPTPGTIVKQKKWKRWGVTELTLSNGVKVLVKPTDYDRDNISMRMWREGGLKRFPDADQPNFTFVTSAVTGGGVGQFSATDLTKMLSGKTVRVTPQVGYENESVGGSSSVKDLETMLQLTNLYFTSPRKDKEVFDGELNRMTSFLTNREANPNVSYNDTVLRVVYGDSPRRQPVKRATLAQVSFDRCWEMYRECFGDASGYTMLLVGNVDIDTLRPLLEKYVASLPAQQAAAQPAYYADPDVVEGDMTMTFTKKMNTPSALVSVFYTFDQPFTSKSDITLDLLNRVLTIAYTDSVREEKGGTYGVSVSYGLDATSRPNAMLKVKYRTDPAKYAELMPIVYRQISNVATQGPEPTALAKAKAYLHKAYSQNAINNGYWDYVIYNYQRYGIDYDTDYERLVDRITADDVRRAAAQMLQAHRRIEVTMLSE